MTILVSGEPVQFGDRLYSRRANAWVTVVQLLDSGIVVSVTKGEDVRTFTASEGGIIAGSRDLFWHAPIELDLPKSQLHKLAKIQALLGAALPLL